MIHSSLVSILNKYDALRDLAQLIQLKKNVKKTRGGVLFFLKVTLFHGCFSRFLDYKNGTKSRKASQIFMKNMQVLAQNLSLGRTH